MTNFNWRRPSANIKGKQKQPRPDRSAPKVVDVPLGEATYGDVVADRQNIVRPYSIFFCLSWCRKENKQHPPPQLYDTDIMNFEQENATPNDPTSTTEVRPTPQEEFELSVIPSQQPEAGPSRLPGSVELDPEDPIFDAL